MWKNASTNEQVCGGCEWYISYPENGMDTQPGFTRYCGMFTMGPQFLTYTENYGNLYRFGYSGGNNGPTSWASSQYQFGGTQQVMRMMYSDYHNANPGTDVCTGQAHYGNPVPAGAGIFHLIVHASISQGYGYELGTPAGQMCGTFTDYHRYNAPIYPTDSYPLVGTSSILRKHPTEGLQSLSEPNKCGFFTMGMDTPVFYWGPGGYGSEYGWDYHYGFDYYNELVNLMYDWCYRLGSTQQGMRVVFQIIIV